MTPNPFRIHGTVQRPDFTDREKEVARILATLQEPGAKLLVYGERRMGKTSAIEVAVSDFAREGGAAVVADLSTASTVADMATRVLDGALRVLGRRWRNVVGDLVRHIGVKLAVESDPVTGLPVASVDVGLRQAGLDAQYATLGQVLDALERLAEEREAPLAVVLDEFQEIERFGGETAEWQLRGTIQRHRRLSYVLSGSKPRLIRRMLGKKRAFYGLVDKLAFGPMDPGHLAGWIDERMTGADVVSEGAGAHTVRVAGPRTRDVVKLARKTYDIARTRDRADADVVERAFLEIVQEEDDPIRAFWAELTPHKQNVLRAVAAATKGLTTRPTLQAFSLSSSSAVSQAAARFVDDGVLTKGGPSGYLFDSPFMRGWVVVHALPDLGIRLPATFRPDLDDD